MIGEPPFAVLMLTIGLGFVLRGVAGAAWGSQPKDLDVPFAGDVVRAGELMVGTENLAIIVGTAVLCLGLYLFFRFARVGIAMQAASQNQLARVLLGHPGQAHLRPGLGTVRGHRHDRRRPRGAGCR